MIIHLNGASSSGKSSLARALQELLPGYPLNFSIDSILCALPPTALKRMTSGQPNPGLQYDLLEEGFYQCARALHLLGHPLIIDNAVTSSKSAERLDRILGDRKIIRIGLTCSLAELQKRERERGDRTIGEAQSQIDDVHKHCPSDFLIDATSTSPAVLAEEVLQQLRKNGLQ